MNKILLLLIVLLVGCEQQKVERKSVGYFHCFVEEAENYIRCGWVREGYHPKVQALYEGGS